MAGRRSPPSQSISRLTSQPETITSCYRDCATPISNHVRAATDFLDRVELMIAIEDQFAGVEITDDDVEQMQIVGDLIRHLQNAKQVRS